MFDINKIEIDWAGKKLLSYLLKKDNSKYQEIIKKLSIRG